jgi:hypothetical protein
MEIVDGLRNPTLDTFLPKKVSGCSHVSTHTSRVGIRNRLHARRASQRSALRLLCCTRRRPPLLPYDTPSPTTA